MFERRQSRRGVTPDVRGLKHKVGKTSKRSILQEITAILEERADEIRKIIGQMQEAFMRSAEVIADAARVNNQQAQAGVAAITAAAA